MQEIQMSSNDEKEKMDNVEDNVFRDFCQQIGVDNIRQYEERELRVARDRDKRRMEFQNQEQRLRNQLEYERSRDTEAPMRKWQDMIDEEKRAVEKLKQEEVRVREDFAAAEGRKAGIEERLLAARRRQEDHEAALGEARKRLVARQKEVQRAHKEITQTEARLESKRAARHGLLRNAKMDGMKLPLRQGGMEDILTEEDPSQDSMNTQDAARIYEAEARLQLDYRHLDKSLRRYEDLKEVSKKVESMMKDVESMAGQLNRIQAPNLRASDKLTSVEQQLFRTEVSFMWLVYGMHNCTIGCFADVASLTWFDAGLMVDGAIGGCFAGGIWRHETARSKGQGTLRDHEASASRTLYGLLQPHIW